MAGGSRTVNAAALWATACLALVYLPDIGHGFIKDDYGWIASSHVTDLHSLWRMFTATPMGFYRPLVSLSFGLNEVVATGPFTYALTNLLLVVAIATGIWRLGQRLGLPSAAALFSAAVWAFNMHGINMSVLWISGRTSLLGTLFAVLAGLAFTASRPLLAGVLTLAALLSKEEPLLLPLAFALWTLIAARRLTLPGGQPPTHLRSLWPSVAAVVIYLAMRSQTAALTPANAPDFYRLSAAAIGGNLIQYLDRSLTFPAALLLLGSLGIARPLFALTATEREVIMKGLAWLVLGFGLTIMLPVRSSLYVLLPSVGSALAAGAVGAALWRSMKQPRLAVCALVILPLALWPVYHSRNARIRNEAVLASHTLTTIGETVRHSHPSSIVIISTPSDRPSIADAFADALPIALTLFVPEAAATTVTVRTHGNDTRPDDAVYIVNETRLQPFEMPVTVK